MEINKNILNIPPYLSTPWKNVTSLYVKEEKGRPILMVALNNGTVIEIPKLNEETITQAFKAHAESLKNNYDLASPSNFAPKNSILGFRLPFAEGDQMTQFGEIMQHNADQMHAAPIPDEVLKKITSVAKAVGIDPSIFPKPEPHCNCPHCQIAKSIHKDLKDEEEQTELEEIVTEKDLQFREWDVDQAGEQLYMVSNPLNKEESYQVFLGKPIGCTCGEKNCEHIRAVLRS
jgi:glutaredoxin